MKLYLEAQHIKHIKEMLFLLTWGVVVWPALSPPPLNHLPGPQGFFETSF